MDKTLALKIDKEAVLEYASAHKDIIFLVILIVALGAGGWYLYQESSKSVDQYIREVTETEQRGGGVTEEEINPETVVQQILSKRSSEFYTVKRSPFGSPEEQLQKRQRVQQAYERAADLFRNKQYEAAVEQFDKVIAMDVTETRIQYPILPSEYKRRAQREHAKNNFDKIYQSAESDLEEGDRLLSADKKEEALEVYKRANENLSEIIDSDPQGNAIGQENFQKLQELKKTAYQKLADLWGAMLEDDIDREVSDARQVLGSQDYIALTNALYQLSRVRVELQNADPNRELVSVQKHDQINSIYKQIQNKIQSGVSTLVNQAETTLAEAISANDIQKAQDAIRALSQARQAQPDNQEIQEKLVSAMKKRADLVISLAQKYYNQQQNILNQEQYDQFDPQGKTRFIAELQQLRDLGAVLDSDTRNQVVNLIKEIQTLRLPPPVTKDYEVQSIEESSSGRFTIEVIDRTARTPRKRSLFLKEGEQHRSGIRLKQVDTENGFVILSKSGYTDAKVALPSN